MLTINTTKQLQFVFIEDKRAAALEPLDAESGYEYERGFGYYKSVRDAGCQFFADHIPSGISTISYESVVSYEGEFMSGPASLKCMYRPDVNAWSGMGRVKVEE